MTKDEMVGWHHQFNGYGFGWTPGVGDGQGSPGRSLCLTKSSACGRLWQCAHPRPLSLLQRGLAPRSKGKARAELRPHQLAGE